MRSYAPFRFGDGRQRLEDRLTYADQLRTRGEPGVPEGPRDLVAQSGSRKVLLTWKLSEGDTLTEQWRIYKDTENNLVKEISDRATRQCTVDVTTSAIPPTYNFFVSGLSRLGKESRKVQVQGKPVAESGAPADPTTPPGYTAEASGGGDTGTCFSGNVFVQGEQLVPMQEWKDGGLVVTERGLRPAALMAHDYSGPMLDMGNGELVTPDHRMRSYGIWVPASWLFKKRVEFTGKVYTLTVQTEVEEERNFLLGNGRVAHNKQRRFDDLGL